MTDAKKISALFDGWEETMVWSCLQGVMGRGEANADGTAGMIARWCWWCWPGRRV